MPAETPKKIDIQTVKKTVEPVFTRDFWNGFWRTTVDSALHSIVQIGGIVLAYLVLRILLYRLIDGVLARLVDRETRLGVSEERTGRLQTLRGLCKSIVSYVLFFVFGVMLLKAVGFDIMPFVTTAGVIGLAIGFGAQKLVKDVISGFFIIIDNMFVVGDVITIGTMTGKVQEMGMRVTRLLDANGRLYLVSNGDIATITNLSRYPVEDFIEINVAPTDLNKVLQVINTEGEKIFAQNDHNLKAAPHVLGITAFTAASVTVRISILSDPRDIAAEQMRIRGRLRDALLAAGIPLA